MPRKATPAPVPQDHQWCHGCAQALLFDGFDKDGRRPNGITAGCRERRRRRARERYAIKQMLDEFAARVAANSIGTTMPQGWEPERPVWL
jgi:hypothetical protein